jgi:hypothetical protein
MSSPGGSFGAAWVHVGTDGRVDCSTYRDALPILTVDAGNSSVTVTFVNHDSPPGERGVAFARDLAAKAAVFAAECERLHAAHQAASGAGESAGQAA